jgi:hypothetical protein
VPPEPLAIPLAPRTPAAATPASPAAAVPAPAAPGPAAAAASPGPLRRLAGARTPLLAGLVAVALAGAAGYLAAGAGEEEPDAAAALAAGGLSLTPPEGWGEAPSAPRVAGLELRDAVGAGPVGDPPALVAGRLPGSQGSVHPAEVARGVDGSPPEPDAVSVGALEGLRFTGLDQRRGGRLTLYVLPTGAGTVVAACLISAGPECDRAVGSLRFAGAAPSPLAAGARFASRLDSLLARLARRRDAAGRRLESARLSGEQARAAAALAAVHRSARRALGATDPPPAAIPAATRIGAGLRRVARGYGELGGAARRRNARAFARALARVRRAESALGRTVSGV